MLDFLTLAWVVLGLIVVTALCVGLLVLLAFGLGWLLTLMLPFTLFETTLLSLAGITIAAILLLRIVAFLMPLPSLSTDKSEKDFEDAEEEEEEEEEEVEAVDYSSIPRWRRPLRQIDFSNAQPDDRCPCGSGRKYKNCHGRKPKK